MKSTNVSQSQISRILQNRDWQLVTPERQSEWQAFNSNLLRFNDKSASDDETTGKAVTFAYCPILYDACKEIDSLRQHRAFKELWAWVYRSVYSRVASKDDADEISQQVLLKVYQHLHQVNQPHSFLGFVGVITYREIGAYYERRERLKQHEEELLHEQDEEFIDIAEINQTSNYDALLEKESEMAQEELIRSIYQCIPQKQRRRAEVFIGLVLLGKTVSELAQEFQTSLRNVNLMYFRARKDLIKHCMDLIERTIKLLSS